MRVSKLASAFKRRQVAHATVDWVGRGFRRLTVQGYDLSLKSLAGVCQLIKAKLVPILRWLDFDGDGRSGRRQFVLARKAEDVNINNEDPGYCSFPDLSKAAMKRLLTNPVLLAKFVNTETREFKRAACGEYLSKAEEAWILILVLVHLCCGCPARATELAKLLIRNLPGVRRSLRINQSESVRVWQGRQFLTRALTAPPPLPLPFLHADTIELDFHYNKTQALTGFAPQIIRFVSRDVAEVIFFMLTVVRQLEVKFTRALHGDEKADTAATFLWVARGERWTDDDIRRNFVRVLTACGVPVSWSGLRHALVAFLRHQPVPADLQDFLPRAEAAGHVKATDEIVYGVAFSEDTQTPDTRKRGFRGVCRIGHRMLKLEYALSGLGPRFLTWTADSFVFRLQRPHRARGQLRPDSPSARSRPSSRSSSRSRSACCYRRRRACRGRRRRARRGRRRRASGRRRRRAARQAAASSTAALR